MGVERWVPTWAWARGGLRVGVGVWDECVEDEVENELEEACGGG